MTEVQDAWIETRAESAIPPMQTDLPSLEAEIQGRAYENQQSRLPGHCRRRKHETARHSSLICRMRANPALGLPLANGRVRRRQIFALPPQSKRQLVVCPDRTIGRFRVFIF